MYHFLSIKKSQRINQCLHFRENFVFQVFWLLFFFLIYVSDTSKLLLLIPLIERKTSHPLIKGWNQKDEVRGKEGGRNMIIK